MFSYLNIFYYSSVSIFTGISTSLQHTVVVDSAIEQYQVQFRIHHQHPLVAGVLQLVLHINAQSLLQVRRINIFLTFLIR